MNKLDRKIASILATALRISLSGGTKKEWEEINSFQNKFDLMNESDGMKLFLDLKLKIRKGENV